MDHGPKDREGTFMHFPSQTKSKAEAHVIRCDTMQQVIMMAMVFYRDPYERHTIFRSPSMGVTSAPVEATSPGSSAPLTLGSRP